MGAEASELIVEGERVLGVIAKQGAKWLEIRADLTIGADGRHSILRRSE